jgi:hypothetical protein
LRANPYQVSIVDNSPRGLEPISKSLTVADPL